MIKEGIEAKKYIFWGIIHHNIHGDLRLSVFLEYVVIAVLGMVLLFSLLFRT